MRSATWREIQSKWTEFGDNLGQSGRVSGRSVELRAEQAVASAGLARGRGHKEQKEQPSEAKRRPSKIRAARDAAFVSFVRPSVRPSVSQPLSHELASLLETTNLT